MLSKTVKVILAILLIVIVFVSYAIIEEGYYYLRMSPEHAAIAAQNEFERECQKRQLKCNYFKGPIASPPQKDRYEFKWSDPTNGDKIIVLVVYSPHYTDSWYLPGSLETETKMNQ